MKYRTLIVQGGMVLGCLVLWIRGAQAAPAYSNHLIYNTDPVLYWRLDELQGAVAYDAAPGTPYNGAYQSTYSHGVAGPRPTDGFPTMNPANVAAGAATGNARVRYTELSSTAGVSTGSYSYQVWFNSSVANWTDRTLQYLFTRGNDDTDAGRRDAVYIGGNWAGAPTGKLSLITSTAAGVVGTRTLQPNRWYHLVVTRNDYEDPANPGTTLGDIRVYLNGKLEMQSTAPWQGGTGNHLTAGNRTDWHSTLGLHGAFDEAAVWNRPLREAEVRNLYYDALGSPYLASVLRKDPAAYWRLEETAGTATAYDFTGNGHSFNYQAASTRTGAGTDLGPRPAEFGGMPADNRAPTLTGGPLSDASNGYLGVVTGLLPGQPGGTNNDYSVEMWVRRGDDPNAHGDYLMHRWDPGSTTQRGDFLGVTDYAGTNEYKLFVWAGDSTIPNRTGSTVLTKGEWHHVAMTRQGDDVRVYLNGLPEISVTLPSLTGLNWNAGTWTFGGRRDLPTQQKFAGNLDEIAVYAGANDGLSFQENYLSAIVQRDVPYAKTTLSFSPESYWRLNETSPYTLAIDATGHGHTFTYHAAASRTGAGNDVGPAGDVFVGFGADNNAPRLSGGPLTAGNGYLGIVTDVLPGQGDYSAQLWFRPGTDSTELSDYLVHRGDGGANKGDFLGLRSGGAGAAYTTVFFYNGATSVNGTTVLTTGDWYHVAMTRNGNPVTVYLNGQPEITTTLPASDAFTGGQWAFGGRSDMPGQQKFTGNLDEIALYGRSLSKFHVQASYLSALARDECDYSNAVMAHGPQAYWRLNEGPQWVAAMDSSGNAHHFEYQASAQRGIAQLGPTPANAMLGFEAGNAAPRLTGSPTGSLTNGYLGIATGVLQGQNDYTAEMWFRRDAVGSIGAYLLHRNDLDAATNTGDYLGLWPTAGEINLFVYDGATSTVGSTAILEDQWHHVAMVREGNQVLVYLDGLLEIEGTIAPRSGTKWVDGTWAFGGRTDNPALNQRFAGSMDEIAIYGYALSLAEIRAHYLVGVPEPSTGLLLALAVLSLAVRRRRT